MKPTEEQRGWCLFLILHHQDEKSAVKYTLKKDSLVLLKIILRTSSLSVFNCAILGHHEYELKFSFNILSL